MYTVKQFEIAKPANVVYSNFRLKDHNVLYAWKSHTNLTHPVKVF